MSFRYSYKNDRLHDLLQTVLRHACSFSLLHLLELRLLFARCQYSTLPTKYKCAFGLE